MEDNRIIKITDKSEDATGENAVEVTTRGYFSGTPENYTLEYDEVFGDGLTGHTVISVKGRKQADIIRTGSIISEMTVEQGKRHTCIYSTPYGNLPLGIYAKRVSSRIHEHGGTLELDYTVDISGNLSATKQMVVQMSKISQ